MSKKNKQLDLSNPKVNKVSNLIEDNFYLTDQKYKFQINYVVFTAAVYYIIN